MSRNLWTELRVIGKGSNYTNTSEKDNSFDFAQKPIEIYVFIDPLCPKCWSLKPSLRKLSLEYGRFFTIRLIISGNLSPLNKKLPNKSQPNPVLFPWAALAIKAAELQGKNAGRTFLRKMQVSFFMKELDVSNKDILIHCAKEAKLDVQEFKKDLFSGTSKRAIQSDLKLKKEMDVDYTPTVVFFNQVVEEQGIKISGLYPYHTYVHILSEMLQKNPEPAEIPSLIDFLASFEIVASKEIAVVFDWSASETERQMKKLQLKQQVKRISVSYGDFWQYTH